jgi:hypothetical protein
MATITRCRLDPHDEPQYLRVKSGMIYCPECQESISWVGFELGEKLRQKGMKEFHLGDKGRNRG